MQSTTGCKINVSPASGRDIERDIGLVGSRGAIEAAKRAIMDKVHAVVSQIRCLPCLTLSCDLANLSIKEEKNRPSGGGGYRDDQYNDRYPQNNQQTYGQPQSAPPAQASNGQGPQGPQSGGEDLYAAYGGYQAYVALWWSHLAQQGQQPQPGQGPPGAAPPGR